MAVGIPGMAGALRVFFGHLPWVPAYAHRLTPREAGEARRDLGDANEGAPYVVWDQGRGCVALAGGFGKPHALGAMSECGARSCGCNRVRRPNVRARFLGTAMRRVHAAGVPTAVTVASFGSGGLLFDAMFVSQLREQGYRVERYVAIDLLYRDAALFFQRQPSTNATAPPKLARALQQFATWLAAEHGDAAVLHVCADAAQLDSKVPWCDVLLDVDASPTNEPQENAGRPGTPPPPARAGTTLKEKISTVLGIRVAPLGGVLRPQDALRKHGVYLRLSNCGDHATKKSGHSTPGTSRMSFFRKEDPPKEGSAHILDGDRCEVDGCVMVPFDEAGQNAESDAERVARLEGAREHAERMGAEVYDVVGARVLVRDHPNAKVGTVLGGKRQGDVVFGIPDAERRASPLPEVRDGVWVQLWEPEEHFAGLARHKATNTGKTGGAYALVDATALGFGVLLRRRADV